MSDFNTFLWVAFPWLAIAAFVIGMIWRWRTDQFGWTSHSSQIYESKLLRLSSPLFHWGILFVFIGHLMGLAIPKSWTETVAMKPERIAAPRKRYMTLSEAEVARNTERLTMRR